jgi:cell division protein FtsQ
MWDNPRLLNAIAGALTALALMVLATAALLMLMRSPLFPLRAIELRGSLAHTTRTEVEQALRGHAEGNFFALDLAEPRAALERLPWVRRVHVRRVWPDALEVTLEEHVPLARWGDTGLLNQEGELFAGRGVRDLPLLSGPAGTEAEVARRFQRYSELLAPLGSPLERLVLSPRYAWQLRMADGLVIELGRDAPNDPVDARLARLVAVYPQTLGRIARKHEYVDLRYPNGFALRVPDLKGG